MAEQEATTDDVLELLAGHPNPIGGVKTQWVMDGLAIDRSRALNLLNQLQIAGKVERVGYTWRSTDWPTPKPTPPPTTFMDSGEGPAPEPDEPPARFPAPRFSPAVTRELTAALAELQARIKSDTEAAESIRRLLAPA